MKTTIWLKSLLGGVAALLGGMSLASAADVGTNYVLDAFFTNSPAAQLVAIWGAPTLSAVKLDPGNEGVTATDGAGKIDGVWDLTVTNLNSLAPRTEGHFIVDINGNIVSVGKTPVTMVRMNVKGGGYVQATNGTSQADASITFAFSGTLSNFSSSVGPFTTNVHHVILNANGTTNDVSDDTFFGTSNVVVSTFTDVGYSNLQFYVNTSVNQSTNNASGTNTIQQHNEAYFDSGGDLNPATFDGTYAFGTKADTNVLDSVTFITPSTNGLVTNVFNVYSIGTNVYFQTTDGTTNFDIDTQVQGFDLAQMPAFIDAYTAGRLYAGTNGVPPTNFVVRSVTTLSHAGSSTTTTVTNQTPGLTYSDTWREVSGKVTGSVRIRGDSQSLNGPAKFGESHSVFSSSPDSNGVVVTEQIVNDDGSFWSHTSFDRFVARVVTVNQKLLLSSGNIDADISDGGWSGKGTLDHRHNKYRAAVRGAAFARGSSANLSGTIGPMILRTFAEINVVSITNVAAFPEVSILATNTTSGTILTPFNYNDFKTNTVGTNVFDANSFYRRIPVPPALSTNLIPDAIQTVIFSGKVMGQKVNVSGSNGGD